VREVQVSVAQRRRIAPRGDEVLADGPDVVLDHLLAAGGARLPTVGARDAGQYRGGDGAHLSLGEVDEPARPVDEHQADGQQRCLETGADAQNDD